MRGCRHEHNLNEDTNDDRPSPDGGNLEQFMVTNQKQQGGRLLLMFCALS
jgi:hypothetical protein